MIVLPKADKKSVDKYLASQCQGLFYLGWSISKVRELEKDTDSDLPAMKLLSAALESLRRAFIELLSMELIEEDDVRLYTQVSESIKDTDTLRAFAKKLDEIASGVGSFSELKEFVTEEGKERANKREKENVKKEEPTTEEKDDGEE